MGLWGAHPMKLCLIYSANFAITADALICYAVICWLMLNFTQKSLFFYNSVNIAIIFFFCQVFVE